MEGSSVPQNGERTSSPRIPRLGLHTATGQWRVVIGGRDYYLGTDRQEARKRYDALIAQWLPTRSLPTKVAVGPTILLVADVGEKFIAAHKSYYVNPEGEPTGEVENFERAFGLLYELFGKLPAEHFSPRRLKDVQSAMVAKGWQRPSVNHQIQRVKRLFKWAAAEELVPASVYHGLLAVDGLRRYRSEAKEPEAIEPVPEAAYKATLPELEPTVRAMVELQYLTGMRVSEVRLMRTGEIDRAGAVWTYKPLHHKTAYFGKDRIVPLGPKAQAILTPWLKLDPKAAIFRADESEKRRYERLRASRKTRVQPSQIVRAEVRAAKADAREHPPGDAFTVAAYRRAIERACKRAMVEPWAPARLRHNAAERIRRKFGVEVARCYLGHSDIRTTQLYSAMDVAKAMSAAAKVG